MRIFKLLLKIGGWFMIATSVIMLTISFFVYRHAQHFVQSAVRVQGTVTKMIERSGHNSDTVYCPVYTFEDLKGKQHEIYSSGGSYPPSYKVGDKVKVLYQIDDPDNAEIDSFLDKWLFTTILAGFGFIELVFGVGLFLVTAIIRKIERRSPTLRVTH
jgi:hypothetical protein